MDLGNRDLANLVSQELGLDVFTKEYDILTLLHEAGEVSFNDLYFELQTSGSTIGRKLGRLRDKGLITSRLDDADLRRRKFALPGRVRTILDTELAFFRSWDNSRHESKDRLSDLVTNLNKGLGIKILGQDYKLIVGCFSQDGPSAAALLDFAAISQGGFYARLKRLQHEGMIQSVRETGDKRKSRIFLSDHVVGAVTEAHCELQKWASRSLPDSSADQ
jgi:DNA-binding MarR family transcriptional regulator